MRKRILFSLVVLAVLVVCLSINMVFAGGVYKSGYFLVTTTALPPLSISSTQEQGYRRHSALVYVEGNSCRWLVNGTPTGNLGILANDDTTITLNGVYDITNFKVILKTGTSTGGVTVHYVISGE